MTFLELCKMVERESGLPIGNLASVSSASGVNARIVGYVADAWKAIQMAEKNNWLFSLVISESPALVIGQSSYALSHFGADASVIESLKYTDDKSTLTIKGWTDDTFTPTESGRPDNIYQRFDDVFITNKLPDAAYPLRVVYRRKIQTLVNNADVPYLPTEYHEMIAWLALQSYALFDNAPELLDKASSAYTPYYNQLRAKYLPTISFAKNTLITGRGD